VPDVVNCFEGFIFYFVLQIMYFFGFIMCPNEILFNKTRCFILNKSLEKLMCIGCDKGYTQEVR
jgi:hypothetical protein